LWGRIWAGTRASAWARSAPVARACRWAGASRVDLSTDRPDRGPVLPSRAPSGQGVGDGLADRLQGGLINPPQSAGRSPTQVQQRACRLGRIRAPSRGRTAAPRPMRRLVLRRCGIGPCRSTPGRPSPYPPPGASAPTGARPGRAGRASGGHRLLVLAGQDVRTEASTPALDLLAWPSGRSLVPGAQLSLKGADRLPEQLQHRLGAGGLPQQLHRHTRRR
jgi:hypothetical protein